MEQAHPVPNPGAIVSPPDERDYKLALGAASQRPEVFMPPEVFAREPVYYQRQIPDCGANLGAFLAGMLDDEGNTYSPDYQWIDIKTFDGYALTDGTDMRSIFKSLTKGSLPYTLLPEATTMELKAFSSTKRITPAMQAEAAKHKIKAYGFHDGPLTFDDLKQLIWQNKGVALLARIGDEFWTDKKGKSSWAEKDILPLRTPKSVVSGHFIVAIGYDKDTIYFANWWSEDWGRNGFGYFKVNYLPQIVQVGTIVDDINNVVIPKYKWKRDLYLGISGDDVQELQEWLNTHGYPVAPAGQPGSAGHETDYYGLSTTHAIADYQTKHGIKPAKGYFGPITRKSINEAP